MQAEQVAICVVQQRKMTIVGMVGAWWLQQAYVMAASSLGGNPVIGCALGLDAVCTTMLAGWSASDAKHQGVMAVQFKKIESQRSLQGVAAS